MDKKNFNITHINLSHGFRGGERQTVLLIQELSKLHIKQSLICRKESPLIEHLKDTEALSIRAVNRLPDARLGALFCIRRKTSLIQAHETLAAQCAFLHHSLFNTPYIITRRVDNRLKKNSFNSRMYQQASALVGVSSAISRIMQEAFNVKAVTIHSAHAKQAINEKKSAEIKDKWQGLFVIGQIGALVDRHKGQSTLIEATKKLQNKIPNLKVVFLGAGSDEKLLKAKAQDLPIEFLGFHDNVADYLTNFDIFAYPSNNEGLGSTILDAMSLHIPVIASNAGGIPELIEDGSTGLLIKPHESDALVAAALMLHGNKKFCQSLTSNAFEVAEAHSSENMAAQYLSLYKKICHLSP